MIQVDGLRYDAIEMKPVDYDWTEGYAEHWAFLEARRCEAEHTLADAVEAAETRNIDPSDVEIDSVQNLFIGLHGECPGCKSDLYAEGPMMSYYYPVRLQDVEDAADALVDTPLCVVIIEGDQTGLALTGGGMDLSWEICEAFMQVGFYPPIHFCDLPKMAGRGQSDLDRKIIEGCKRSLEAANVRATRGIERLDEILAEHRPEEKE